MTWSATTLPILLTIISFSQLANADVLFVNEGAGDFRIASITDLDIDGILYNVTFHNETDWQSSPTSRTYDDYLANSGVTDPITFNSFADATTASLAVRAEIAAANVDASSATSTLQFFDIPFAETASTVSIAVNSRSSINPLLYNSAITPVNFGRNSSNLGPSVAILEFDVAGVPEPSSWALLMIALIVGWVKQLYTADRRVTFSSFFN